MDVLKCKLREIITPAIYNPGSHPGTGIFVVVVCGEFGPFPDCVACQASKVPQCTYRWSSLYSHRVGGGVRAWEGAHFHMPHRKLHMISHLQTLILMTWSSESYSLSTIISLYIWQHYEHMEITHFYCDHITSYIFLMAAFRACWDWQKCDSDEIGIIAFKTITSFGEKFLHLLPHSHHLQHSVRQMLASAMRLQYIKTY